MSDRCYTVRQLLGLLQLSRTTFFRLRERGQLPFLEELLPRLGRNARFRAEPVDRYLDNRWGGPRVVARRTQRSA